MDGQRQRVDRLGVTIFVSLKYFTRDAFIIVNARRVILIIPVVCVIYPTSPIFTVNFLICQELQNPLTPLFKVVACILFYRY